MKETTLPPDERSAMTEERTEPVKLKLIVAVGRCHRTEEVEIPDEDLEGLDEKGREKVFTEYLDEHVSNNVDAWWEVVEE